VRRVALVVPGILAVAAAVALPGLRDFLLGLAIGGAGAVLVPWLARRERVTVAPGLQGLLRELEGRGWAVSHDDHLVVGPPGAYVLEARAFDGQAVLEEGGVLSLVRADGGRMGASIASRMRGSAKDARRLLGAANLHWVRPVVVLWCEFPAQVAEHGGVTYVHGDRLLRWLNEQPGTVSPQSLESARSCLRRLEADAARAAA
jgi:hypothetical protein